MRGERKWLVNTANQRVGIFLESDLVAIKSIDDILRGDNATSTVMARRLSPDGVPNWLIMSKPGGPFLKQWMQAYEGEWDLSWDESTWKDDSWEKMAVETPTKLAEIGGQGLVILDGHSWFYPLAAESDGDAALKKLWFGKSWDSIDESYGTHVWHWDEGVRELVTPRNIRMIDTPLFCQIRPLFDDLDSDGYIATAVRKNANCSSVRAASLKRRNHRMFSDYRMTSDEHDIKWVDSSGYHLHGWAPKGTPLRNDAAGGTHRMMGEHSFAVLPVPSGWDTRTWTARMDVKLDPGTLDGDKLVGLFKIRTERDGDILTRVGNQRGSGYTMDIEWRDLSRSKAKEVLSHWKTQTRGYIQTPDLRQVQQSWHHVAITFDRREKGEMGLYIDGVQMGTQPLSLQKKPDLGQEIWINAREWDEIDMGFRGSLGRFTMYADALTADTVNQTIPANAASLLNLPVVDLEHVPVTKPQGSLFFILMVIMALSLVLVRMKKGIVRDGLWHVREGIRRLRIWFLNR